MMTTVATALPTSFGEILFPVEPAVNDLNLTLFAVGLLTLVLSLLAGLFKRWVYPVSEPMLAVTLGVLLGPLGLGLLRLEDWGDPKEILEQVARLTVGVSGVSTALRLPKAYFPQHARTMAMVIGPGMLIMWFVSGLLVWWLLDVPFWTAMLIGAVVTPTDPVISGTIVTGETAEKNIPERLRHAISGEAGANDGGAYPLVFLAILMILHPPGEALSEWATRVLLWEVLAAVVMGYLVGYLAGRVQRWSESKDFMETTSLFTVILALTAVTLGGVKLIGSDGILAAFAAGLGFNRAAGQPEEREQANMQEAVNRLFSFPAFVFFGMALPVSAWSELGWGTLAALAALILLLRRIPMMVAVSPLLRPLQSRVDVLFNGWFGPIGIAAVFYAVLAANEIGNDLIWTVGSFLVVVSIAIFGVTSTPFTLLYGYWTRYRKE